MVSAGSCDTEAEQSKLMGQLWQSRKYFFHQLKAQIVFLGLYQESGNISHVSHNKTSHSRASRGYTVCMHLVLIMDHGDEASDFDTRP